MNAKYTRVMVVYHLGFNGCAAMGWILDLHVIHPDYVWLEAVCRSISNHKVEVAELSCAQLLCCVCRVDYLLRGESLEERSVCA